MFKLTLKNGGEKPAALKDSVMIHFFDEAGTQKKWEAIQDTYNLSVSSLQEKSFLGEKGNEIKIFKPEGSPDLLIINKVKVKNSFSNDYFRNYLAGFIPSLENQNFQNLQIVVPDFDPFKEYFYSNEYFCQSFIEGVLLGNYKFDKYFSELSKNKNLNVFFYGNQKQLDAALKKGQAVMEGVYFARELENEPSSVLTPVELARRSGKELAKYGITAQISDIKEIKKKGYGGIIAVGKGSDNPPQLMKFHYKPSGKAKKKVVLVGKGVTFDSGGISIKPSAGMGEMKADMSGAAAVIGTLLAAAKAKLPVDITVIIPAVENMPSGKAIKPGDIIKTSSGKSIEIDNTDAEGRLILADALELAAKEKPDVVIDLATLTGACVVALGEYTAGVFTKNDSLADDLYKAGINTFERVWRLPLWDEYSKLIKSDVADVKNVGGKWGGAITAAKFLENFAPKEIPWAHIDIAGPSIANNLNNYTQKYMTGYGVRLLFEYLISL